jgi:hypothetical protein
MRIVERKRRTPQLTAIAALAVIAFAGSAYGALQGNENIKKKAQVIIGADNDEVGNGTIQPIPSPPGADQSLKKSDQIDGGGGNDTLVGRLGSDVFRAGGGDDVIVGGTEGGQPAPALPNSDIAYGGSGSDAFIWAPGDGSDAFIGGNPPKGGSKSSKGKGAKASKKSKKSKRAPELDTLVVGNLVLTSDNSTPQLFQTKFGQLPKVFSSDRGVPTPLGGTPPRNPNTTGLCEIVPAPAGLGHEFLVRFFGAPGNLLVTIRTKGVEQVICPTVGSDGATLTTLGRRGSGPVVVETTDFKAAPKSKLAAFVF